jgi:hypothetical protein
MEKTEIETQLEAARKEGAMWALKQVMGWDWRDGVNYPMVAAFRLKIECRDVKVGVGVSA